MELRLLADVYAGRKAQRRRFAADEDLNVGDPGEERLDLVGQRRRFAAGEDLNLRTRHRMILMSNRADGRPQLSPVS